MDFPESRPAPFSGLVNIIIRIHKSRKWEPEIIVKF